MKKHIYITFLFAYSLYSIPAHGDINAKEITMALDEAGVPKIIQNAFMNVVDKIMVPILKIHENPFCAPRVAHEMTAPKVDMKDMESYVNTNVPMFKKQGFFSKTFSSLEQNLISSIYGIARDRYAVQEQFQNFSAAREEFPALLADTHTRLDTALSHPHRTADIFLETGQSGPQSQKVKNLWKTHQEQGWKVQKESLGTGLTDAVQPLLSTLSMPGIKQFYDYLLTKYKAGITTIQIKEIYQSFLSIAYKTAGQAMTRTRFSTKTLHLRLAPGADPLPIRTAKMVYEIQGRTLASEKRAAISAWLKEKFPQLPLEKGFHEPETLEIILPQDAIKTLEKLESTEAMKEGTELLLSFGKEHAGAIVNLYQFTQNQHANLEDYLIDFLIEMHALRQTHRLQQELVNNGARHFRTTLYDRVSAKDGFDYLWREINRRTYVMHENIAKVLGEADLEAIVQR